jgi:hypothetical protein
MKNQENKIIFRIPKSRAFRENKKAQIEIQETAFVLLAVIMLAVILLLFFIRIQSSSLKGSANELREKNVVSNLGVIASMPEISCSQTFSSSLKAGVIGMCVDEDKLIEFKRYSQNYRWQGISKVEIRRIYPPASGECSSSSQNRTCSNYILYDNGNSTNVVGMASFVSLCRQEKEGYDCNIAKLIVSTQEL